MYACEIDIAKLCNIEREAIKSAQKDPS